MSIEHHHDRPEPGDQEVFPRLDTPSRQTIEALLRHAEQLEDPSPKLFAAAASLRNAMRDGEKTAQWLRQALEDPKLPTGVAQAAYAILLFNEGRQAEAFETVNKTRKLRPTNPRVFEMIGGALLKHGHCGEAAKWYTTGLVRHLGDLAQIELGDLIRDSTAATLVRGRHQARQSLGLAPDHLDELAQTISDPVPTR